MGIWARGPTAESLYEGLALALVGAMTDRRAVRATEERKVDRAASDPAGLAVGFLSALLLLFQTDGFLARSVRVRLRDDRSLWADLRGEPFDPARHPRRIEVKAITFHEAQFDPARGRARIILDI